MSPRTTAAGRRRLSRTPAYARRDRRELVEAVGVVVLVLGGTAVCVWAMRPGGIAGRQPRAILLGLSVVAVLVGAAWLLVAPGRRFSGRQLIGWALAVGAAGTVLVVGIVVWPGGIVLDEPTQPTLVPDPITDNTPPLDPGTEVPTETPPPGESPVDEPPPAS